MTITLDLAPDIEQGLLAQAQAKGLSIIDYVEAASASGRADRQSSGGIARQRPFTSSSCTRRCEAPISTWIARRTIHASFDIRMRGYLLDTNVISEYNRETGPHVGAAKWMETTPEGLQHVSVLTLAEIEKGIFAQAGRQAATRASALV